eukprot:gene6931-11094_t
MWKEVQQKNTVEPKKVVRHIGFTHNDKLFIQAGTTLLSNSTLDPIDVLKVFDFQTKKWTQILDINLPSKRTGHSFVKYKNKIFIYGGTTGSRVYLNDLHEFDLQTSTFSKEIYRFKGISDRFGQTAARINEKMIIFGGMLFSFQTFNWKYYNDFYEINLDTKDYKRIILHPESDEIEAVGAHSSIENEKTNEIYIFGGLNSKGRYNLFYCLSLKDNQYFLKEIKPKGEVPSVRAGSGISFFSQSVYITGGYDGNEALNDTYRYDINSNMWYKFIYQLPFGIRLHSMNIRQFREGYSLVIFGGVGKDDNEHHGDILELVIDCNNFMKSLFQNSNYLDVNLMFHS